MNIYEAEQVLGLFEHYDEETLKKQYRIMSRKYHPDNCKQNGINEKLAEEKIKEINLANNILTNHLKRYNNTRSNYYNNTQNSEYDKLKIIIVNDLEQKLKLNKLSLLNFKQLMLKFNADSILNKCKRFIEVLQFRCYSFEKCDFENHQTLNDEYQKYILRYKKDLTNIYYEFCKVYLIKYVNESEQANWILEKINQNKEFLLLSEVISEINNDLELLMLHNNEDFNKQREESNITLEKVTIYNKIKENIKKKVKVKKLGKHYINLKN